MTTIVTEFEKFRYNPLPIGVCASGDKSQAKLYKLLGNIEGVKTYIYDILVLSKKSFSDHIEQLCIIFVRLHAAGLKVNYPKHGFGLKGITYLVYVITSAGIKHDPNKMQGIMYIGRPTTKTEARTLIGMDQYYRNIWTRSSHILSPLTEAASGPKGRKYFGNIRWNIPLRN